MSDETEPGECQYCKHYNAYYERCMKLSEAANLARWHCKRHNGARHLLEEDVQPWCNPLDGNTYQSSSNPIARLVKWGRGQPG